MEVKSITAHCKLALVSSPKMFNRHKLSTNKFAAAIRDTFVQPISYADDISREDLELLVDTQQQQDKSPARDERLISPSDADARDVVFVDAPKESTEQSAAYEQQCNQQQSSHLMDNITELVKIRTGFDEVEFRSQLASLHASTQSAFKAEVDSLYDFIDEYVNEVSQSLLVTQQNVLRQAEELIKKTRENILEADEMERELEKFMEAVHAAYEWAFSRARVRD